jgi:acyl dehydratase
MPDAETRPEPLYLEDLSTGMKFSGGSYAVTEEEIIAFAKQYDPQPFHCDPEAAKQTFFQGLAASGWHTAAITMRLLAEGAMPFGGGSIGLGAEVSWVRPVRPGEVLSVENEVMEIMPSRSKPHQAIVTLRTTTRNDKNQTVQIMTSKVLAFNRGHIPGALS